MPTHACINGAESDNPSWWEHDYQGIPLCRVCDNCRETKLARYRPEILTGYDQGESLTGEHSPPKQPKPRTQPCYVCDGFGSRASDDAYMMMHTEPCTACKGSGKLDMLGRALASQPTRKL